MLEQNIFDILKKRKDKVLPSSADVDALADTYINRLLTEKDKKLLGFIFKETVSQEELDKFFENWDIEVEGGNKNLMLAYFMKMHPELKFSDYTGPRLKGLLNYYKFKNIKLLSQFSKICNKLEKEGISSLIIKGGAMKFLRPEYPRVMGDIDILVHEEDFEKAGKIVEEMGYDCDYKLHSVDLHPKGSEEGILDIHRFINVNTGCSAALINKNLFKRATHTKVFGVPAYVPCNEDLLFVSLMNMSRNIVEKTSVGGLFFVLFDIKFLLGSKPDFNWDIVIENAKKTKTEVQISFMAKFINKILPDFLPEQMKKLIFDKQLNDWCILLAYNRLFLWGMKQRNHQLRLSTMFSSWGNFVEYIKLKPKYWLLKPFKSSPTLAKFIMGLDKKYHIVEDKYAADKFYK